MVKAHILINFSVFLVNILVGNGKVDFFEYEKGQLGTKKLPSLQDLGEVRPSVGLL